MSLPGVRYRAARLANGNYRVVVKDGLATSIRKSKK